MKTHDSIVAANADTLSGTSCVDARGRLIVMHHATNKLFETFDESSDLGYHFGSRGQAEKRRANMIARLEADHDDPWRIVSAVLSVKNPLVIADDPGVWPPRWLSSTLFSFLNSEDKDVIRGHAANMEAARNDKESGQEAYRHVAQWLQTIKQALTRAGHDGIVYRNIWESTSRGIEWSWVVFDDSQIIRLGDRPDLETVSAGGVEVGKPLQLRGAGPMRKYAKFEIGDFVRQTDAKRFRAAIEEWANEAGIAWDVVYPLDYQPSFGECRPRHDLEVRIGNDEGYGIRVSSRNGEVVMQPLSKTRRSEDMLSSFDSKNSEHFYDHGIKDNHCEALHWSAAETIEQFVGRLDALYEEFGREFSPEGKPAISGIKP